MGQPQYAPSLNRTPKSNPSGVYLQQAPSLWSSPGRSKCKYLARSTFSMHRITRPSILDYHARHHDGLLKMPNREGSAYPLPEPGVSRSGWVPSPQQGPHCAKSDGGHLRDARSGTLCSPPAPNPGVSAAVCRWCRPLGWLKRGGMFPATMVRRPSEEHDGSAASAGCTYPLGPAAR